MGKQNNKVEKCSLAVEKFILCLCNVEFLNAVTRRASCICDRWSHVLGWGVISVE